MAKKKTMAGKKPRAEKSVKSGKKDRAFNTVRCDACGCAFVPELVSVREGEIEFTHFTCEYCGKAYIVCVTDEALRQDIRRYGELMKKARKGQLDEAGLREAIKIKNSNLKRGKELRRQYLKEEAENEKCRT